MIALQAGRTAGRFLRRPIAKGGFMAFRPNYNLQRADRNRAAKARSEQKQRKREEKSAQRKAERAAEVETPSDDAQGP
jgi:hypothetical protein